MSTAAFPVVARLAFAPANLRGATPAGHAIGGEAFCERTEGAIDEHHSGGVQDADLNLPRLELAAWGD